MSPLKCWLTRRLPIAGVALFAALHAQAATIGVPENMPPWGLSSTLPVAQRGIYADMADAIVARVKEPVEIRFVPYGRMLQEVKSGELDYAFGVIGPATTGAGPFITIIGKVPMVAVARKGLTLKTLADLHGFTEVGYLRGGSCGAAVDGDTAINRVAQDGYDSAIRKMAAARLDGWCSVKGGFTYALSALKMEAEIGDQIDYGEVKLGFQVTGAKAESAEAHAMSAVVEKLVSDGVAGQIIAHYLGAPYPP
jgi:ABC-type amino acid transport substrate-binding protein